ncbi:metallopeptidase TldD-related protein [Streptomonospora salina]|uniref:Putative Zn-dependent protease n=1 Tax=Streptomonospora salina TaxID=104205 RepID=A0A841E207_9ACTN|nr:metallopeptidase TldD-related protein [Streptomonospora salina]MBB5996494.1 putative Zn-dependent protease [Streptomonospora salina]
MSGTTPQAVVERVLGLARADGCMVLVEDGASANLRWAGNSLTTNGSTQSRTVTVIALCRSDRGVSVGVRTRTGVAGGDLEDLVRAAEAAASQALPAEDAVALLEPGDTAVSESTDWDAPVPTTDISVFSGLAPGLGRAFRRGSAAERRFYGYAEHTVASTFFGSSTGVRLRHDQPSGTVELNAKTGVSFSTADGGHSAWAGRATRDFADVDAEELEDELARRVRWSRQRVDLPAGRYETLMPPSAVADMMALLYFSATARDAAEGRTVFSGSGGAGATRVGERLADMPLTLFSDPAYAGLECAPFVAAGAPGRRVTAFDNGRPLGRTEWISDGTLAALPQTRRSAELTGLALTPHVENLVLESGSATASLDEMIARTERGLLLTCLWYVREVDPQSLLLTGLTRDGVYLVEDGEVTGAVNNFRFNESPVSLLDRATEAGATVPALGREIGDSFPRTAMPPLRIPDFNMSTVSQAS